MVIHDNPLLMQFHDTPSLIACDQDGQFRACMTAVSKHPNIDQMMAETASEDGFWPQPDDWRASLRPYIVKNGVLQIPIKGVLLHNFPWAFGNWATGYAYIERAFLRGCEDYQSGDIKGIAFVVDSPGGMVAGCFDATDKMDAAAKACGVPVRAFAHESAYSAAYALIAKPADKIIVSRTGGVGSIGVVTCHVDWSKWNEQAGLKYTYIYEAEGKVDGNPDEPLSARALKRIKTRIGKLYGIFVESVAEGRNLDEDEVRDLKSFTYSADDAISNGLADEIGTLDDAMAAYVAELSTDDDGENAGTAPQTAIGAVTLSRRRISTILSCNEAEGRSELAYHIAFETDMSVEAAKMTLSKAHRTDLAYIANETEDYVETPFDRALKEDSFSLGKQFEDDGAETIALARQVGLAGVRQS